MSHPPSPLGAAHPPSSPEQERAAKRLKTSESSSANPAQPEAKPTDVAQAAAADDGGNPSRTSAGASGEFEETGGEQEQPKASQAPPAQPRQQEESSGGNKGGDDDKDNSKPAEPAKPALSLKDKFRAAMDPITHQWGFLVVRTAYHPDPETDAAQWARAYDALCKRCCRETDSKCEFHPGTSALPVLADRDALGGKGYDDVREILVDWIQDYISQREEEAVAEAWRPDSNGGRMPPHDIREEVVLVVDEGSLASLVAAAEADANSNAAGDAQPAPWVVVIDMRRGPDPSPAAAGGTSSSGEAAAAETGTGRGRGRGRGRGKADAPAVPYLGWMRAEARALHELWNEFDGDGEMGRGICPRRQNERQIPVYTATRGGRLVDME